MDKELEEGLFMPKQEVVATPVNKSIIAPSQGIAPSNEIQQVINQQLHIMQQQIDLLRGTNQSSSFNSPLSSNGIKSPSHDETISNKKLTSLPPQSKEDGKGKGFGPWKTYSQRSSGVK